MLRPQLSTAWDLAFNWVVNEPYEHHAALPLTVCLAIATLAWGWVREASIILMCWTGLLRIREALAAIRSDFILPRDAAAGVLSCFLKIHQPKTRGRSAKHQVAKIDFPDVIALLDAIYGSCLAFERLWRLSAQSMRSRFKQLQTALGLNTTRRDGNVPYELSFLRPGGAAFFLQRTENGNFVRRRERWLTSKVLEPWRPTSPDAHRSVELIYWSFLDISKKS